jgi:hypothetical protein
VVRRGSTAGVLVVSLMQTSKRPTPHKGVRLPNREMTGVHSRIAVLVLYLYTLTWSHGVYIIIEIIKSLTHYCGRQNSWFIIATESTLA